MYNRYLPLIIFLLVLGAIYVNLGDSLPIKFSLGPVKINKVLEKPDATFLQGRFGRGWDFRRGLDLAGGTNLVLSADMKAVPAGDRSSALDSLQGIIERRINFLGVSEPVVQTSKSGSDYRLIVEIPGVTDVNTAVSLVGKTAELTFREEINASDESKISSEAAALYGPFQIVTDLTGKDLRRADPSFDQQTGQPNIQLSFTTDGAKKFADITQRNIGKRLAIFFG